MPVLRVVRSLSEAVGLRATNAAVTVGVFDGVHSGHRYILDRLVKAKHSGSVESCFLVTFDPHPIVVTHSRETPPMLTTIDERVHLLSEFDLDGILVLTFDKVLAGVHYRDFLVDYLVKPFDMRLLVLGYDNHLGRNREGSPEKVTRLAKEMGLDVDIVEAVKNSDHIVSSAEIRNAIETGNLGEANRFLGHPYLISGSVVEGEGRGRDLGFPTANIGLIDPCKLRPAQGVYAVRVKVRKTMYKGMMNVGRAPTMKSLPEGARNIEVHLFDFDGDLYGEKVLVFCHAFLREERKFPSAQDLADQLAKDKVSALERLREGH
ncbi:MAG: riboflavin biosynthesis protein RibF [bacterium]|nr:riboflavin biosynthesis protein RibF [bacterium]